MIETIMRLCGVLLAFLPFLVLLLLDSKANLKKPVRSRQFLMPVAAVIGCVVTMLLVGRISEWCLDLVNRIPYLLGRAEEWLKTTAAEEAGARLGADMAGRIRDLGFAVGQWGDRLDAFLRRTDVVLTALVCVNTAILAAYLVVKKILLAIMKRAFKNGSSLYELAAKLFYDYDYERDVWYLKPHFGQARTYLMTFYRAAVVIAMAAMFASVRLYQLHYLAAPFHPVFAIIMVGEIYFLLGGLTKEELEGSLGGEDEKARSMHRYVLLRQILKDLFGDKLTADDTTVTSDVMNSSTNDELLTAMARSGDTRQEAYSIYMRRRMLEGMELDQNYLSSGRDLLLGKSILFNDPFYCDLIPYAFYAMDRTLLRHKKVLVVLGRHGIEEDVITWCREGLQSISNVPDLWRVAELSRYDEMPDVGIISRSAVHDLRMHEKNHPFFEMVEFVMIIEPSKLVTTAQVGLNSVVRHCRAPKKDVTFCSVDKNCDGLVDALSHILMTNLTEVSATNHHKGTCTYMCWAPDQEYLQHRMLPNVSRYLGVGTELSFVALKNQVSRTMWYGGDAFPVADMHWIVKQYYYDLLHYANLPLHQEMIDKCFVVSQNLWNERQRKVSYLTIEDESYNLFELKRNFATRATEQSFINVISPEYLLRDYMTENDGIFNTDPKAIPYIVADYARTRRNVAFRLCLRMSSGYLREEELKRELMLVHVDTDNLLDRLWDEICTWGRHVGKVGKDESGEVVLTRFAEKRSYVFSRSVIQMKRRYSIETGRMETLYTIVGERFKRVMLNDLQNARYIAEDEDRQNHYLGTELRGHIYQKYLPGQFLTFNGKYYEMISVTPDGQVQVRRAADHIVGRPSYRQVREYVMSRAEDCPEMGACRDIGGIRVTRQYADFRVKTPAYWQMGSYNDFANARKVTINGIPEREYYNKQVLRLDFPSAQEGFTDEIRYTLTVLFNEVFRTLFAENQSYIVAVTAGEPGVPLTYGLRGADGSGDPENAEGAVRFEPDRNAIYLIEDSQLDIGLLVAVERNLYRIFSIVCDYLDWHLETLDGSLNPPPKPETPDFKAPPVPEGEKPKKKGPFSFLKELFGRIFGRKNKKEKPKKEKKKKDRKKKSGAEAEAAEPVGEAALETAEAAAEAAAETSETETATPDTVEGAVEAEVAAAETVEGAVEAAAAEPEMVEGAVNVAAAEPEMAEDAAEAEAAEPVSETVQDAAEEGVELPEAAENAAETETETPEAVENSAEAETAAPEPDAESEKTAAAEGAAPDDPDMDPADSFNDELTEDGSEGREAR